MVINCIDYDAGRTWREEVWSRNNKFFQEFSLSFILLLITSRSVATLILSLKLPSYNFFLFSQSFSVDFHHHILLSILQSLNCFLMRECITLKPVAVKDLLNSKSLSGILFQHVANQLFCFFREETCRSRFSFPKSLHISLQFGVPRICYSLSLKRWRASQQNIKYDTHWEDVSSFTIIFCIHLHDFWSSISRCTFLGSHDTFAISTLK